MSVTYGFYNSLNGDRKYDATQLSSLFDGVIVDGVFASIGSCFVTKASTDADTITVGSGKAWFNSTWILNDSIMSMAVPISEVLLDRIDALVIEIDSTEAVRENSIKIVKGTPSSQPSRPVLTKSGGVYQYPICYIYRPANSTVIKQADITNMVGTDDTPFITGILKTISMDELLGQWEDELDQFVTNEQSDFTNWMNQEKNEYDYWFSQMKDDLIGEQELLDQWIASEQADFTDWFNQMKDQLNTDAAGNLQLQIDKNEIERILLVGFIDGNKTFSEDGTIVTSTASDGRTLTKTFTDNFLTITSVLKSSAGSEIARMIKSLDPNGKIIETTVSYF